MSDKSKKNDRIPAREAELAAASCSGEVRGREVHETKVADEIEIGTRFRCPTAFFSELEFEVKSIDREKGTAKTMSLSGETCGHLRRRNDGWYDQHCYGNAKGIVKVQFY